MDSRQAIRDLKDALGDFLGRQTSEGVFHVALGGPGSVPELSDLAPPELHLDYLGDVPQPKLELLGYHHTAAGWEHADGWRLLFSDEDSGWRAEQQALRELLLAKAEARANYRHVYQAQGRQEADEALREEAREFYAQQVGFAPTRLVAQLLAGHSESWMFAAGMALELHLGRVTRPHDDLDVIFPRSEQHKLRPILAGWRLDAALDGQYHEWTEPLQEPHFQIHARSERLPAVLMLDIMLTEIADGQWVYRRDPSITLPLSEARRFSAEGLPYLAPQAILLFKAGRMGQPRPKDEADFRRILPTLTLDERRWLAAALEKNSPQHIWLRDL